jgi:rRNA pseudouridine-1189 N-methylase Emg1 (Nep1/Mra1 family)
MSNHALKPNDTVRTPKGRGRFIGYMTDCHHCQVALEIGKEDLKAVEDLGMAGIVQNVQTFFVGQVEAV